MSAGTALSLSPGWARASVARAVSLTELVYRSQHVVAGTSVDAWSLWENVGRRSRIVTYSVVRVEQPLDGRDTPSAELAVRTLGGVVGDTGQIVHGEAVVALKETAAMFLTGVSRDVFVVTEMAQGYYAVQPDVSGVKRLRARVGDLELAITPESAVHRLDGRSLTDAEADLARELVRGAR